MSDLRRQPAPGTEDTGSELRPQDLWFALVRNRWLVVGVAAVVVGAAAVYTWRVPPLYEAGATLRVDAQGQAANPLSAFGAATGTDKGKIETEMAVLRSRRIAEMVADSLGLRLRLVEPQRPRDQVVRAISVRRDAPTGKFELRRQGDGTYRIEAEDLPSDVRLPEKVAIDTPFQIGSATIALAPGLRSNPPEKIRFNIIPFRAAASSVRGGLNVFRPHIEAHVVSVGYQSTDPELAAAVPNAVTALFMADKAISSKSESRSTVGFLREQVASYERQLEEAENALRSFREQQQVVSPTDEASQQVIRLAQMQAQRDALLAERQSLARLLSRVQESGTTDTGPSPYRQLAAFPTFLSNPTIQDLLRNLTTLENERAELLVRRQPANEDVQGVQLRIDEIERQLFQVARNYQEGLDVQIASAESSLERFGTQLEAIPAREVEYARRQRQQALLAEMYTLLQTRLKEAEIRQAVEPGDLRVIDEAIVPLAPIYPRPVRNMGLALVLGLLLGGAAAIARQVLDHRIRSREDAEMATGGAAVLGLIPRIRTTGAGAASVANGDGKHRKNGKGAKPGIVPVAPEVLLEERLVTRMDPRSPASEAYRALRTNITFAGVDGAPQVIVVTSAMPGDGKTTSSSNLAITLAQQGTRTLLVDADLRRGVLHNVFGLTQDPGLTHVLHGHVSLDDAIQKVSAGDSYPVSLDILTGGVFPPNPAELLGSERMKALVAQLRERYDTILFDAPPLNLVTDAAVLGTVADATILVARTGVTDKRALHFSVNQLHHLRAPLAGVVLNDIDVASGSYYGYGYGYGYGQAYYGTDKTN